MGSTMSSAQHKARAEELLAEVEPILAAFAGRTMEYDDAEQYRGAALVSFAQIHAHALLALYPDGSHPIQTVRTF